jgi:hypothetical protein
LTFLHWHSSKWGVPRRRSTRQPSLNNIGVSRYFMTWCYRATSEQVLTMFLSRGISPKASDPDIIKWCWSQWGYHHCDALTTTRTSSISASLSLLLQRTWEFKEKTEKVKRKRKGKERENKFFIL